MLNDLTVQIGPQIFSSPVYLEEERYKPYWVNPDWLLSPKTDRNYGERDWTPAINRFGFINQHSSYTRAEMTEHWQWFQADVLALQKYGAHYWELGTAAREFIKTKFTSLYHYKRFATNGTGFGDPNDPRANYVKGENLGSPNPAFEPFICATITVWGEVVQYEKDNGQIIDMLEALAWNMYDEPPNNYGLEILHDQRMMFAANIRKDINPNGTQDIAPFDQLNDPPPVTEVIEVPYPFVVRPGNGYYPLAYLTPGLHPKYNPPWIGA